MDHNTLVVPLFTYYECFYHAFVQRRARKSYGINPYQCGLRGTVHDSVHMSRGYRYASFLLYTAQYKRVINYVSFPLGVEDGDV